MTDGPNIDLIVPPIEDFIGVCQAADRLGFHALWATERVFHSARNREPFNFLASAAAATSQIRLGTGVLWNLMRDPVALAAEAANVDRLSGGRLTLGMAQDDWPGEQRHGPASWARQGGRLEEAITLLKRLWSEDEVSFRGNHFRPEKASIISRPVQPGGIPILVGSTTLASVRLGATLADGWVHPSGGIPQEMVRYCQEIRALASQVGRDSDSLELGKIIYLAIDNDEARARHQLSVLQNYFGASYNLDRWCAFGPPAQCAAFLRRFLDSGINTLILCIPKLDVDDVERLHREVVSLLQ